MAHYTDANKNEWQIEILVKTLKDVKRNVKDADGKPVDLMSCVTGNLTFRLLLDPCLLVDILWQICKPYAETKGLTQEQFAAAQKGETLDDGLDALMEALVDFFPKPLKTALTQTYKKGREMQEATFAAQIQTFENGTKAIRPTSGKDLLAEAARISATQNASGN